LLLRTSDDDGASSRTGAGAAVGERPGETEEQRRGRGIATGRRGGAFSVANPQGPDSDRDPPIQGDPVPGVDVSIEQNPGRIIISSIQTNSSGYFQFSNVPAGSYVLRGPSGPGRKLTLAANGSVSGSARRTGIFLGASARGAPPAAR
jgi:hypothetical protein